MPENVRLQVVRNQHVDSLQLPWFRAGDGMGGRRLGACLCVCVRVCGLGLFMPRNKQVGDASAHARTHARTADTRPSQRTVATPSGKTVVLYMVYSVDG